MRASEIMPPTARSPHIKGGREGYSPTIFPLLAYRRTRRYKHLPLRGNNHKACRQHYASGMPARYSASAGVAIKRLRCPSEILSHSCLVPRGDGRPRASLGILALQQTMSTEDHVCAGNVRVPIVRAELKTQLASRPVLVRRPAFSFTARQYQRRGMREMIRVAHGNRKYATSRLRYQRPISSGVSRRSATGSA